MRMLSFFFSFAHAQNKRPQSDQGCQLAHSVCVVGMNPGSAALPFLVQEV